MYDGDEFWDVPGPMLLHVVRELGYFPELPTSLHMFYREWDELDGKSRLGFLKLASQELYGHDL